MGPARCSTFFASMVLVVLMGSRSLGEGRPNFVFFLDDDLSWTDPGCHGSGFYDLPDIDRLVQKCLLTARCQHHDGDIPGATASDKLANGSPRVSLSKTAGG